jgi:hypothetical protein
VDHRRRTFQPEEDELLRNAVAVYGESHWDRVASLIRGRTNRQCRERWTYYLSPTLDRSGWTTSEDRLLLEKHREYGPKWVSIGAFFPHRTPGMLKNRFNLLMRRKAPSKRVIPREARPQLRAVLIEPNEQLNEPSPPIPSPGEEPCGEWGDEFSEWFAWFG